MEVRVVCGLAATIASLVPSSAFSSVDLPALGRPRMVTNPARCLVFFIPCDSFRDADLIYSHLICRQNLNGNAVPLSGLASRGNMPQPFGDQAADGGRF